MNFEVCEIFHSIQGESSYVGLPCAFVRMAGCNLRCRYCDTPYAQEPGTEMSMDEILEKAISYGTEIVEITGGEPLIQESVPELAEAFIKRGRRVLVETNGTKDISVLPRDVVKIMDIKCPSSGQNHMTQWENAWKLSRRDEVKFVIADRQDYEWTRGIIRDRFGLNKVRILLSTVFGELPPRYLAQWMLEDKLIARFQLQIQKVIWPHDSRGV
jgi:7-carboxy-7-deazaguanine synthase